MLVESTTSCGLVQRLYIIRSKVLPCTSRRQYITKEKSLYSQWQILYTIWVKDFMLLEARTLHRCGQNIALLESKISQCLRKILYIVWGKDFTPFEPKCCLVRVDDFTLLKVNTLHSLRQRITLSELKTSHYLRQQLTWFILNKCWSHNISTQNRDYWTIISKANKHFFILLFESWFTSEIQYLIPPSRGTL